MAKKIEHEAANKGGMTLDELSAFVSDALNNGAKGDEIASAAVTLRGLLRSVKVNVPAQPISTKSLTE